MLIQKNKNLIKLGLIVTFLCAHQPVMDMAPRWKGGYGFQIRYERFPSYHSLQRGDTKPYHYQNNYYLEGVYTLNRSKRITFKLPYHVVSYHKFDSISNYNSIGDLIVAIPLKKYSNLKRRTQNFGFTPQIRIPVNDRTNIASGHHGLGISLSYSSESFKFYQLYDVFYWRYHDQDPLIGLDINLGIHPYHDNAANRGVFIIWDITSRYKIHNKVILTGPVVMSYHQNIMVRFALRVPILEKENVNQLSKALYTSMGIGVVF